MFKPFRPTLFMPILILLVFSIHTKDKSAWAQSGRVYLPVIQALSQGTPTTVQPTNQSTGTATTQATSQPTSQPTAQATPVPQTGHPRLWITAADLPRLRSWATDANLLYKDGLAVAAQRAKADMDAGRVPGQDCGNVGYEEYPTESYAEFFAFLSLVENDAVTRSDYANRARTLLMYIMNEAAKGPASEETYTCNESQQYPPFRHPDFFTSDRDRARYHGEAFPLVVDWIYPTLTTQDKTTIRTVFLRWSQEIIERGYHHPEPVGVISSTVLLADKFQVRFSANNYYLAHMRNLGLMALALDAADDSGGQLRKYLDNATGAYLYIFDHLIRNDSRGGLLPEGLEYSPQSAGYVAQFLLALHTTGVSTVAGFNTPPTLTANPFWDEFVSAYLHSISPATTTLAAAPEIGPVYQPAFYGDGQHYRLADFIDSFAALGIYDTLTSNSVRLNAARWIQTHTAPGGAARLSERVSNPTYWRESLLYFLLLDPTASAPSDPRPARPLDFLAPGMSRFFSRSAWDANATWFTYGLSWNSIDHQMADGNNFAFYRQGEWLTKGRVGYANIAEGIASSEFYNTIAIQNGQPNRDPSDWRTDLWQRGSQWNLVNSGDPRLIAHSANPTFAYALGDATNLYNANETDDNNLPLVDDVVHASRSILWLKPDHIIVYDRAATKTAGRFKRWWLQLPKPALVNASQATMTTDTGQQLFITSLLPADAILTAVNTAEQIINETAASDDPMKVRLRIEGDNGGTTARFFTVLQGADSGVTANPVALVRSVGDSFEGAIVANTAILFPLNHQPFATSIEYTVPASVTKHLLTGLKPNTGYSLTMTSGGNTVQIQIVEGGATQTDEGGVLVINK